MGGKLGTHKLGQFKLGDSDVSGAVSITAVTGMFDPASPGGDTFDSASPGATMFDPPSPS